MFQLLPCSICQRTFSLRKDVGEETLLKCPSCGNQFRLGDVLDAFYSPWIILDEPGAAATQPVSLIDAQSTAMPLSGPTDSRLSFDNLLSQDSSSDSPLRSNALTDDPSELAADDVFNSADLELPDSSADEPALLVDNSEVRNSHLESSDLESEIELDDEPLPEEPIGIGSHQYESPMDSFGSGQTVVKKSRLRKSERGGVWSVVQVILGGAAAIPVTVLLLWYVVGKDVMDAGPTVARYVPWIVPKKFRTNNQEFTQRPTGPRVPPPALGEGGFRNFDEELKQQQSESSVDAPPVAESGEVGTSDVKSAGAVQPVSSDSPAPIKTTVNEANVVEDNVVEDKAMIQAFATVKQVKGAIASWNSTAPDANEQALAIFNDLAGLAEKLDTLSSEGGGLNMLKNELGKVGTSIIRNQPLRYQLFLKSPVEYKDTADPAQVGRLVLVPAEEVEATETSWIIRAKVGDSKVTIEVPKEVLPEPAKGAPIFCLGQANDDSQPNDGQPKSYRIKPTYLKVLN